MNGYRFGRRSSDWLYLHTQSGVCRVNSAGSLERISDFSFTGVEVCRVIGLPVNYGLIAMIQHSSVRTLYVGCPHFVGASDVVRRLTVEVAAYAGKWHKADDILYQHYSVLAKPENTGNFYSHPLWDCFAGLGGCSVSAAERFVRDVGDPRWFVNRHGVTGFNKLYRYFGLDSRQRDKQCSGSEKQDRRQNLVRLVLSISGFDDWKIPTMTDSNPLRSLYHKCRQLLQLVVLYWLQLFGILSDVRAIALPTEAMRLLQQQAAKQVRGVRNVCDSSTVKSKT